VLTTKLFTLLEIWQPEKALDGSAKHLVRELWSQHPASSSRCPERHYPAHVARGGMGQIEGSLSKPHAVGLIAVSNLQRIWLPIGSIPVVSLNILCKFGDSALVYVATNCLTQLCNNKPP